MAVPHWRVAMAVCMRFAGRIVRTVRVTVMLVMHVPMFVIQLLMKVVVLMSLGKMDVDADRHQHARGDQRGGKLFAEHQHG